jgi:large subunit ribosomal protein L19
MRGKIDEIERELLTKKKLPKFNPGDTIQVHIKAQEADRERLQIFEGIVIARKGSGTGETFTVRKIVQGTGVERVFLIQSPKIAKITIKKHGRVRRAKLYYLRDLSGRKARVEEVFAGQEEAEATPAQAPVGSSPAPQ